LRFELVDLRLDAPRVLQDPLAREGEDEALGGAVEEAGSERLLEGHEPAPHGGRLDLELARSPRERPGARDREEVPEIAPLAHALQYRTVTLRRSPAARGAPSA
jgi:hypothetical protein